jgi:hypothetical protein
LYSSLKAVSKPQLLTAFHFHVGNAQILLTVFLSPPQAQVAAVIKAEVENLGPKRVGVGAE